jgi:hypothetical protein
LTTIQEESESVTNFNENTSDVPPFIKVRHEFDAHYDLKEYKAAEKSIVLGR